MHSISDSSCGSATPKFSVMAKPNLTDEDYSDLAKLVREAIDAEPYRIGPRIKKLRALLAKLDPSATSIRPKSDPSWWPQR